MRTCDRCSKPAVVSIETVIHGAGGVEAILIPTRPIDLCAECRGIYLIGLHGLGSQFHHPPIDKPTAPAT